MPQIIQEWECVVREISDDVVWLGLLDATAGDTRESELAEVPWHNFTAEQRVKMRRGTLMNWKIEESADGVGTSTFTIPNRVWTQEMIDEAGARAEAMRAKINWE